MQRSANDRPSCADYILFSAILIFLLRTLQYFLDFTALLIHLMKSLIMFDIRPILDRF